MFNTVKKPILPCVKDLTSRNVKEFLMPSGLVSWWSAANKACATNIPQFVSYGLVMTDNYFIALIDKFTSDLLIVYEILETNIKNRKFIKKMLWEASETIKPIKAG